MSATGAGNYGNGAFVCVCTEKGLQPERVKWSSGGRWRRGDSVAAAEKTYTVVRFMETCVNVHVCVCAHTCTYMDNVRACSCIIEGGREVVFVLWRWRKEIYYIVVPRARTHVSELLLYIQSRVNTHSTWDMASGRVCHNDTEIIAHFVGAL